MYVDHEGYLIGIPFTRLHNQRCDDSEYSNMSPQREIPSFDELPVDKKGPHGNAWGLWGPDDQLGTLNYLTPEVVAQAVKEEVQTGQRISLK